MNWTINAAAAEWGIDRRTLSKRMAEAGFDIRKRKEFTTKEICHGVYGDMTLEKLRRERNENELLEREIKEKDRILVEMAEVESLYTEGMLPARQRLLSLPKEMANRCNPTDPQFAHDALQRWVDDALPLIREQMPKPKMK